MLAEFIERTAPDPFEWGRNDCALWAASAVKESTGFDPAAGLRGTYGSWAECRNLLFREGGLLRLVEKCMAPAPARALDDDGLAVIRFEERTLCGLIVSSRAAVKMRRGVRFVDDFELLRGWSVCPRR